MNTCDNCVTYFQYFCSCVLTSQLFDLEHLLNSWFQVNHQPLCCHDNFKRTFRFSLIGNGNCRLGATPWKCRRSVSLACWVCWNLVVLQSATRKCWKCDVVWLIWDQSIKKNPQTWNECRELTPTQVARQPITRHQLDPYQSGEGDQNHSGRYLNWSSLLELSRCNLQFGVEPQTTSDSQSGRGQGSEWRGGAGDHMMRENKVILWLSGQQQPCGYNMTLIHKVYWGWVFILPWNKHKTCCLQGVPCTLGAPPLWPGADWGLCALMSKDLKHPLCAVRSYPSANKGNSNTNIQRLSTLSV